MELDLPTPVLQFLAADSSMYRAQLRADHPDLDDQLAAEETRGNILTWLRAEDRRPDDQGLLASVLGQLRVGAQQDEAEDLRPFTLHPDRTVRQRAYEFLLTLHFPSDNPPAMAALLQSMLLDPDDQVRGAGARFVEQADLSASMARYLRRWLDAAGERGWADSDSYRLVERLVQSVDSVESAGEEDGP